MHHYIFAATLLNHFILKYLSTYIFTVLWYIWNKMTWKLSVFVEEYFYNALWNTAHVHVSTDATSHNKLNCHHYKHPGLLWLRQNAQPSQQFVTQDSDYVAIAYTATQDSNQWHDCHAGQPQQPGLTQRLPETNGAKVLATSDQVGFLPRKLSPDGATVHIW